MSAEEDTELRDLISQTLNSNGVIDKMKAELRATVFLALEEEGCIKDKIPMPNPQIKEFVATPHGKQIISLVHEFLEYFNLNFTLSILEPETGNRTFTSREELCKEFKIKNSDFDAPVIAELLKAENLIYLEGNKQYNFSGHNQQEQKNKADLNYRNSKKRDDKDVLSTDYSDKMAFIHRSKTDLEGKKNMSSHLKDYSESFKIEDLKTLSTSIQDTFYDSVSLSDQFSTGDKKNKIDSSAQSFKHHSDFGQVNENISSRGQSQSKPEHIDFASGDKVLERKDETFPMNIESVAERSLYSFKNLPSLNVGSSTLPDLNIKAASKNKFSPESNVTKDYSHINIELQKKYPCTFELQKESFDTSENLNKCDKENRDNSEPSIEEEIEDDYSAGIEDLLSSISVGDETTNDVTISQTSDGCDCDHLEFSRNK